MIRVRTRRGTDDGGVAGFIFLYRAGHIARVLPRRSEVGADGDVSLSKSRL